jgi:hypothetical protein
MITTDQRPGQLANADLYARASRDSPHLTHSVSSRAPLFALFRFEAEIEKYLRSNGIRFKRQDELTQGTPTISCDRLEPRRALCKTDLTRRSL